MAKIKKPADERRNYLRIFFDWTYEKLRSSPWAVIVFFLPAFVFLFGAFYLSFIAAVEIRQEKTLEVFNIMQDRVDLITESLDGTLGEQEMLSLVELRIEDAEWHDAQYGIHFSMYDKDFTPLTARTQTESIPFEPLAIPEVFAQVNNGALIGSTIIYWEPGEVASRNMYLYWRWTDIPGTERYLIVSAIADSTIVGDLAVWVQVAVLGIATYVIMLVVFYTCFIIHLTRNYERIKETVL